MRALLTIAAPSCATTAKGRCVSRGQESLDRRKARPFQVCTCFHVSCSCTRPAFMFEMFTGPAFMFETLWSCVHVRKIHWPCFHVCVRKLHWPCCHVRKIQWSCFHVRNVTGPACTFEKPLVLLSCSKNNSPCFHVHVRSKCWQ